MNCDSSLQLRRPLPPDRTYQQLLHHYCVEKELADKLRGSSRNERTELYGTLYEELFQRVPDHPRLTRRDSHQKSHAATQSKLRLLQSFVDNNSTVVEIAAGDCRCAIELCSHVKEVYAVDISDQSGQLRAYPENFHQIIYDGYQLDLPDNLADLTFSDQLIEHIHPQDILLHFQLAWRILKPQGQYLLRTPHRLSGPHDISGYFCNQSQGFHLKEYGYRQLIALLRKAGFKSFRSVHSWKGVSISLPLRIALELERIIACLPQKLRRSLARLLLADVTIAARK